MCPLSTVGYSLYTLGCKLYTDSKRFAMQNDDFYGMPIHTVQNEFIRLSVLAEAGPRIVRLGLAGSDLNLLAETPETFWETPHGRFYIRGGHRLWHAPERMPRTYLPDNEGLRLTPLSAGVHLEQPREPETGLVKSMTITLDPDRPAVTIDHQLRNEGVWPVECAPWAITQMRVGGTAVFPQQTSPIDADGLLPNRQLALWPYARWADPRLTLQDDYIYIGPEILAEPIKIGCFNRQGWLAYCLEDILFTKQIPAQAGATYPDFGCNAEIYANNTCVELESLGPLNPIAPGESASHREIWQLHRLSGRPGSLAEVRAEIQRVMG
jgi:hypothetical protein